MEGFFGALIIGLVAWGFISVNQCQRRLDDRVQAEHEVCAKVCAPNLTSGMNDGSCVCRPEFLKEVPK